MVASTVRQIHASLSGALGAAERWGWISTSPARIARRPKQTAPDPDPADTCRGSEAGRGSIPRQGPRTSAFFADSLKWATSGLRSPA